MADEYAGVKQWEDANFEDMSWHNCYIHTLGMDELMPDQVDLVFDLDYVCRVTKTVDRHLRFHMAPALLRFRDVHRLSVRLSLSGGEDLRILSIERSPVHEPPLWYHWTIKIGFLEEHGNRIEFDALGFVQKLNASPVEVNGWKLSRRQREAMMRKEHGQPPTS